MSPNKRARAHTTEHLDVKGVARRWRVHPQAVYREVRAGRLLALRIGAQRRLRFRLVDVEAFEAEAVQAAAPS